MNCLSLLRSIGFLRGVFRRDIEEADDENISRSTVEHTRAVERSIAVIGTVSRTSGRLLESIHRARRTSFAEMEASFQRIEGRRGQL